MKHSKFKYSLFFVATIGICFAIGFGIGAFPDHVRKLRGQKAETLKILFSDEKMVPRELLAEFESSSGIHVEATVAERFYFFQSEVNKVDILFAPLSWFGSLQDMTQPAPPFEAHFKNLFSDFRSPRLSSLSFLPFFWSVDTQNELSLWGFFTGAKTKDFHPEIKNLLTFLAENQGHLARWTRLTNKATTFTAENIDEHFRPQLIRKYQLSNLKILDRLEILDH